MRIQMIEEGRSKPVPNPPAPAEGERNTFVVTFDWGADATRGMLDALRTAGYHSVTADRYPRTTLICRVAKATRDAAFTKVISDNLLDNGSAMAARREGPIYVWPDRPWEGDEEKKWRVVNP
jgi:hypothetical protein